MKATAAFFDFDGTLIPGYSIVAFLGERLRQGDIEPAEAAELLWTMLEALAGGASQRELVTRGFSALRGHSVEKLARLGERLFAEKFADEIFPEMRRLIEMHQRKGHTIVLASSAGPFQVEPAARSLGIEHVLCTRLMSRRGIYTGEIDGPVLWGDAKAQAVRRFASTHGVELARSYFYADGDEDVALMHLVGNPRPTNPHAQLETVARRLGWPVQRFTSRSQPGLQSLIRYGIGVAALVPALIGATALRLLTGNRREAANLLTSTVLDFWVAMGQVKLNIVGEQHLWSRRPAVFIFNHRNNFDAQITGKLVRRDFGAVAKKELQSNPIFAAASQFIDIAFIDRSDTKAAVAALQPCTKLLTQGISMIMAPEGERHTGSLPGPFKKGPFRVAMAARVPVIPIVFRNSDDIGPRSALVMRPGTLDIAVLPPISVRKWTLATLDAHIARVRQLYIDTLRNWPRAGGV